ncbi:hypothetical protein [Klebsiella pneumoniae]|uniref:hypothetical protein n=1 Tax=Klebsiella pneumoniae TaxID=573 RepID=UPI003985D5B3
MCNLLQDLVRILNLCDKLAQKKKDNFISSELFVLAALDIARYADRPFKIRRSNNRQRDSGDYSSSLPPSSYEQMRGGESVM